jgi:hypothetical protein
MQYIAMLSDTLRSERVGAASRVSFAAMLVADPPLDAKA